MKIDGSTTVRDLLTAHPEVFGVLLGQGMCADCQADPPSVPLDHFAMKHCEGNLEDLVVKIKSAIG